MTSARASNPITTGIQVTQKKVAAKIVTIRWTLPLCAIAPLISGIALTSWLAFRSGQAAVESLIGNISTEIAANVEKQVASYLERPELVSATLLAEVTGNNLSTDNVRQLGSSLWQLTQSPLLTDNLYYGNELGEFVYSESQTGEAGQGRIDYVDQATDFKRIIYPTDAAMNLGEPRTSEKIYNPRERPWYPKENLVESTSFWSEVYIAFSREELTLTRVTPVFDPAGNFQGAFGIDVYLNEISDFMRGLNHSENSRAFIIEPSGDLIASSATEAPFLEKDNTIIRMPATSSQDPLIRETARQLAATEGGLQQVNDREIIEFKLNGETQMAYIYRFEDLGVDWIMGIVIPHNDYMGTLRANTRRTTLVGLTITAIASLLALAAALHIIRPIQKLNQAAYDIKNNHFEPDSLVSVIARFDEFSDLAQLFSDMATVVGSREQSLAEQVQSLKTEINQNGGSRSDRQKLETLLQRAQQLRAHYQNQ